MDGGIFPHYDCYVKAVRVNFDSSWSLGSTASFNKHDFWGWSELFRMEGCPKVLQWRPHQPVLLPMASTIIIAYTKGRCHRTDIVTDLVDVHQLAEQAGYRQGEAHFEIQHSFSFGRSTTWVVMRKLQFYIVVPWNLSVSLEFADSEDCFRFIHRDTSILPNRSIGSRTGSTKRASRGISSTKTDESLKEGGRTVIEDILHAIIPVASKHYSAQLDAVQRGLSCSRFLEEFSGPEAQLIRRRASNPFVNHARPCYLTLHLEVYTLHHSDALAFINRVNWDVSTIAPTISSSPFRSVSNLRLNFPASTSQAQDRSDDSDSSQPTRNDLTINISANEISLLTGTNSVSAGNSCTITSDHRIVNINYIMGDVYWGPINGGNVGGRNNVNFIHT